MKYQRKKMSSKKGYEVHQNEAKNIAMTAITDEQIAEYVSPYPFELLTEEDKRQAREEIYAWKNGGGVLDGLTAELQLRYFSDLMNGKIPLPPEDE